MCWTRWRVNRSVIRHREGRSISEQVSFVDAHLAGEALLDDIDDWVDDWHGTHSAPDGRPRSLANYLGMAEDEYALWAELPESLRFLLAARQAQHPASESVELAGVAAAAARADNDAEATAVLHWLRHDEGYRKLAESMTEEERAERRAITRSRRARARQREQR